MFSMGRSRLSPLRRLMEIKGIRLSNGVAYFLVLASSWGVNRRPCEHKLRRAAADFPLRHSFC